MKKFVLGIMVLLSFQTSQAAFIDNGAYLTDTETGLDWLDVTASTNRSYSYVSNQFGVGGEFEGYRFATGLEFDLLLANWTGKSPVLDYDLVRYPEGNIDDLVQILGNTNFLNDTNNPDGLNYVIGITADIINGEFYTARINDEDESLVDSNYYRDYSDSHNGIINSLTAFANVGSFLVRDTTSVNESASALLLFLGLFGLGVTRRLRRIR